MSMNITLTGGPYDRKTLDDAGDPRPYVVCGAEMNSGALTCHYEQVDVYRHAGVKNGCAAYAHFRSLSPSEFWRWAEEEAPAE